MIEKLQKGSSVTPGHYGCPLWNINIFCIWQPLIICLPFFKVWPPQKQDKDDFKHNLNSFTFLSRRNARATFLCYQPLFSKKIGCKTYFSLLSTFFIRNLTWTRHDFMVRYWKNKLLNFFQKDCQQFYKVLENVTISIFSHFLASNPFSCSFFVFICYFGRVTPGHWNLTKNLKVGIRGTYSSAQLNK